MTSCRFVYALDGAPIVISSIVHYDKTTGKLPRSVYHHVMHHLIITLAVDQYQAAPKEILLMWKKYYRMIG